MTPLQEDKQPNLKMGKGLEQTLLQGRYTEGPETYETMLSITSHQRDAIKTTMRYHLTPVRVANINNSTNKLERMQRKGNPHTLLVGMQTGAATVESSVELPQKLKWNFLMTQEYHFWEFI